MTIHYQLLKSAIKKAGETADNMTDVINKSHSIIRRKMATGEAFTTAEAQKIMEWLGLPLEHMAWYFPPDGLPIDQPMPGTYNIASAVADELINRLVESAGRNKDHAKVYPFTNQKEGLL